MREIDLDGDAALALAERRWFASQAAVRAMQAECDTLREVIEMAECAWRRARIELARLETLRDALGDELAAVEPTSAACEAPAADAPLMTSAA